jgi:hypothetical protein
MPTAANRLPPLLSTAILPMSNNNLRILVGIAALVIFETIAGPLAKAQFISVPDCSSHRVDPGAIRPELQLEVLELCRRHQANVIRANRNYCLAQIDRARRLQAAGRPNAWGEVPSACLY